MNRKLLLASATVGLFMAIAPVGAFAQTVTVNTATPDPMDASVTDENAPLIDPATGQPIVESASPPPPPPPPPVTVTTRWNGAPETREEDRRFRVNGRIMFDMASTNADYSSAGGAAFTDGLRSYFRRAFIGAEGRLTQEWRYNVKFDLAPGGTIKLDDAYMEYAPSESLSVYFGNTNFVAPIEDRDSSTAIQFNERSFIMTAAGWGKRPGVAFMYNGGNFTVGGALQSNDALEIADTASNGTESSFVALRGTWAPIFEQTPDGLTLLHVGASFRSRDIASGNGNALNGLLSYTPGALSNKAGNTVSGVGAAASDTWLGAEVAGQMGPFGFEAEYAQIDTKDSTLNTVQTADATATGYYIDLFFSPTGESRAYKLADGSFGNVKPIRTLGSEGGIGHIMLSARYESLDLEDAGFANSSASADRRNTTSAVTLGATWIPIEHVKFQLNVSRTEVDYLLNDAAHLDNTSDSVVLRTQLDW